MIMCVSREDTFTPFVWDLSVEWKATHVTPFFLKNSVLKMFSVHTKTVTKIRVEQRFRKTPFSWQISVTVDLTIKIKQLRFHIRPAYCGRWAYCGHWAYCGRCQRAIVNLQGVSEIIHMLRCYTMSLPDLCPDVYVFQLWSCIQSLSKDFQDYLTQRKLMFTVTLRTRSGAIYPTESTFPLISSKAWKVRLGYERVLFEMRMFSLL